MQLTTENQRQHKIIEELKQTGDKHKEMYKKDLDIASVKLAEGERQQALLKSQVKKNFLLIFFIEITQYLSLKSFSLNMFFWKY